MMKRAPFNPIGTWLLVVGVHVGACDRDHGASPSEAVPTGSLTGASADGPRGAAPERDPARPRCDVPADAILDGATVPDGYCPWVFAQGLAQPRGMVVDDAGRVLVVERGEARVTALVDEDDDGVIGDDDERRVVAAAPGLNHGVAVHDGHLYASSPTTVFRWPYAGGRASGDPEVVLRGMPDGGHTTRTLVARGRHLYVSVGSRGNVDGDSARSRVVRIALHPMPAGGYRWGGDGVTVWADGLRNEVGLTFGPRGRLWGVQNGIDNLTRADLGGDIHADNPAEELNLLDQRGAFHGYPYCWTEFRLDPTKGGRGRGTQWAHPATRDDKGDAWCRSRDNVRPPELAMQAHAAPLDLAFYDGTAFPESVRGDLFVSFHGSWNRPTPTGYEVVRVPFANPDSPKPPEPFLRYRGDAATAPAWPHRPVALAIDADGVLLVTSDRSGVVIAVGYRSGPKRP